MARCWPTGQPVWDGGFAMCSPNAIKVDEGRKSFPSGAPDMAGTTRLQGLMYAGMSQLRGRARLQSCSSELASVTAEAMQGPDL